MKKWVKITLISGGIITGLFTAAILIALGTFIWALPGGRNYNTRELAKTFNGKRQEILEAKRYFKFISPRYKDIEIEFDGNEIARLEITRCSTAVGSNLAIEFLDWNIPIGSKRSDSLMKVLDWNNVKLKILRDKLNAANCISITNGEPAKIGFKKSRFGMYFFKVFDNPIPDSLIRKYNDSCTYVYVNRNLVLEYAGGAVGPQCFSELK